MAKKDESTPAKTHFSYYDLDGNVVLTGPFTITATRTAVEAPAPQ